MFLPKAVQLKAQNLAHGGPSFWNRNFVQITVFLACLVEAASASFCFGSNQHFDGFTTFLFASCHWAVYAGLQLKQLGLTNWIVVSHLYRAFATKDLMLMQLFGSTPSCPFC